ncbi:hypothetical protein [Candidatus Chlamydia sanziniae]|uniref:Uncharacterized protein n=1 Tax=Candidatus Chlamydia sanziniae TaxID=1806891 RepID=A0A1A9HU07_9CHLA|nr:hypothetical protein [Candidatus Chlamydia sanziniae]ANH78478.1 hypothetical protein Cs308_0307 [Candidatus Chlamydia sanziniae]
MILDFQFSIEYYLRVIELVIRDSSRILAYDKKRSLLEAWPISQILPANYDTSFPGIQKAIHELFGYSEISYAVSSRLLAIIELRLHEESQQTCVLYRFFSPKTYLEKKATLEKLTMLQSLIFFERQQPIDKISLATQKIFTKRRNNFSSWEDFTYEVRVPKSNTSVTEGIKESVTADVSLQAITKGLMTLLENHTIHLPLSLDLLEQFLLEKAKPLLTLSEASCRVLHAIARLFLSGSEDFYTIVGGILSSSLSGILVNPVIGSQPLSPEGKIAVSLWEELVVTSAKDSILAEGFLTEVVRKVVTEDLLLALEDANSLTPEQVGNIYSIRDCNPMLWKKMVHSLLMRWLSDRDQNVYKALKKALKEHNPHLSFWQQCLRLMKSFFRT